VCSNLSYPPQITALYKNKKISNVDFCFKREIFNNNIIIIISFIANQMIFIITKQRHMKSMEYISNLSIIYIKEKNIKINLVKTKY